MQMLVFFILKSVHTFVKTFYSRSDFTRNTVYFCMTAIMSKLVRSSHVLADGETRSGCI